MGQRRMLRSRRRTHDLRKKEIGIKFTMLNGRLSFDANDRNDEYKFPEILLIAWC